MPRGNLRIALKPPVMGLKTDVPPHLVPDDFLTEGVNVLCRDGAVRTRPGYGRLTDGADPFSDPVMGIFGYVDQDGTTLRAWAASLDEIYEWNGSSWTDRTGTDLTGDSDDQVRMALFQTSTDTRTILTNNADAPRLLVTGSTSSDVSGLNGIVRARDVTVSFQRAILGNITLSGGGAPSTLAISDKDDPDSFPAINLVDLSDTNDTIVAVRALNTQSFAVYKDNSVWLGIGAANVYPFTFELKALVPGPVSPGAVVTVYDKQYYLAQDGMIYVFDGHTAEPVGLNVYRTIQADMDFSKAVRSHGFFDRTSGEVVWFYPSVNHDSGSAFPGSAIVMNIRNGAFSTLCRFTRRFSASTEYKVNTSVTWSALGSYTWATIGGTFPTWDSFPTQFALVGLLGGENGRPYIYGTATNDNGEDINMEFELPLREYAGEGRLIRIDAVETMWKLAMSSRDVDVILRTSNTMEDSGTEQTAQSFDLATSGLQKKALYEDKVARYISVKHRVSASEFGDEWRGGTLYLYDRGEN